MTGKEASGQGELGATHRDGAVADVVIKHATDRVFQVAVARQEMSERGVAVTVLSFGGCDYLIASDLGAGALGPQESLDSAARVSGERQQTVGDDQAPALMNGLRGIPCSYSSWTSELNAVPDGSRPTRVQSA